jgi:hypothetical protein
VPSSKRKERRWIDEERSRQAEAWRSGEETGNRKTKRHSSYLERIFFETRKSIDALQVAVRQANLPRSALVIVRMLGFPSIIDFIPATGTVFHMGQKLQPIIYL